MPKLPAVLLVDDDPATNFINTRLLQRLAVTDDLRVALNGQQALREVQAYAQQATSYPILIFLDINMPVMDGIEFLEAYQQLPAEQQRGVVVVMLTTSFSPYDRQRAQALPIADYLDKPLTQQQVERVLAKYFPD